MLDPPESRSLPESPGNTSPLISLPVPVLMIGAVAFGMNTSVESEIYIGTLWAISGLRRVDCSW